MIKLTVLFLLAAFVFAGSTEGAPVLRTIKDEPAHTPLLSNGGFEELQENRPTAWRAAPKGFSIKTGEGRNRSVALACENGDGIGWYGASQTVTLERASSIPLIVRGWSRAESVTGSADSNYSLYVDLQYQDGTPLWGQSVQFRCGTHEWEEREFVIVPEKPVKSVTLHCLFRGHAGRVWFDEVSLSEVVAGANAVLFQGAAFQKPEESSSAKGNATATVNSGDGLRLTLRETAPTSLLWARRECFGGTAGGFMVRDVAANSDFFGFREGGCGELGLRLSSSFTSRSNHIAIEGRLSDTTGRDRAVTLVFAVPLKADGWHWGDDIRRERTISGGAEYASQVSVRCGATGTQSLYPVGAVWDGRTGVALALDMGKPAVYRIAHHAGLSWLTIAFDFGLAQATDRFPQSADFRFVLYGFDGEGGFRAAWEKLAAVFPDHFVVRSSVQGLWMPFTDVSKVPGWQDFGFRYHEGNNNVPWDDEHGVLSFRYTEPMTWWMPMAKEIPRTMSEALRVRDRIAQERNESRRRMAEVSRVAAMHDEAGEPEMLFRNEPWANGAVWSLNPNPWLGIAGALSSGESLPGHPPITNAATVHWSELIKERLYGAGAKGRLDGEYLDSLEGYVTAELNFRREHFRTTTVPLTFSSASKRPALFKGLAVWEFTRWIADDVHRMGQLMFANGVPYRFPYLAPWLDVLGTETDWLSAGKYRPPPKATLDLWRTVAGAKPYLLLMNSDYDAFTFELVEKYFQRALFYGMWPGFFSHNAAENPYWQNPKWYERDRPLFRKYIPLIRRVAEAGWRPRTWADSGNSAILAERFGPDTSGAIYFTIFNDSSQPQSGILKVNSAGIGLNSSERPKVGLGPEPESAEGGWRVRLEPEQTVLLEFRKKD